MTLDYYILHLEVTHEYITEKVLPTSGQKYPKCHIELRQETLAPSELLQALLYETHRSSFHVSN